MRLAGTWLQGPGETAAQKRKLTRKWSLILAICITHATTCFLPTIILPYFPPKGPSDGPRWAADSAPRAARQLAPRAMTQNPGYGYFMRNPGATTRSSRHSGHHITHDSDRVCFMNGWETRTLLGLALGRSFSIWFTNSLDLCPSAFSRF